MVDHQQMFEPGSFGPATPHIRAGHRLTLTYAGFYSSLLFLASFSKLLRITFAYDTKKVEEWILQYLKGIDLRYLLWEKGKESFSAEFLN